MMLLQNLLILPSSTIGFNRSIRNIFIGLVLKGINLAFTFVPILGELIEILEAERKYDPNAISDLSIGMFNAMFSVGNVISPLIGGYLSYAVGPHRTCEIIAVS